MCVRPSLHSYELVNLRSQSVNVDKILYVYELGKGFIRFMDRLAETSGSNDNRKLQVSSQVHASCSRASLMLNNISGNDCWFVHR